MNDFSNDFFSNFLPSPILIYFSWKMNLVMIYIANFFLPHRLKWTIYLELPIPINSWRWILINRKYIFILRSCKIKYYKNIFNLFIFIQKTNSKILNINYMMKINYGNPILGYTNPRNLSPICSPLNAYTRKDIGII